MARGPARPGRLVALAGLAALLALPVAAQSPGGAPSAPLRITVERDLAFGLLAVLGSGGEAHLGARSSQVSVQGDVVWLGGPSLSAQVLIEGAPRQHVVVVRPESVVLRHRNQSLVLRPVFDTAQPFQRLDADGTLRLRIGGQLLLPSGTAPGDYRGPVRVSASQLFQACPFDDPDCPRRFPLDTDSTLATGVIDLE